MPATGWFALNRRVALPNGRRADGPTGREFQQAPARV